MDWLRDHKMGVLGFAVSAAYWPGMLSAAFVPRWAVIAVGIPLVSRLDPRAVPDPLRWVLAWLLALAALTTAVASPDKMTGWLELFFGLMLCLVFCAGAALDSLDDLMTGVGAGLALSAVLCITQYFNLFSPFIEGSHPSGLFYSREVLAEFSALVFVWALLRPRVWVALMALPGLLLCGSRVAWVAAAIAVLYTLWPARVVTRMALAALIGFTALAMLFAFGPEKAASADHRFILWGATILSTGVAGHGLGWFQAAHPFEQFAHSDVLQVMAELGAGAFVLALVPIAALVRKRGNHAERALFVAICVECLISFPLHVPASGFLAAIVAGYLVSDRGTVRVGEPVRRVQNVSRAAWPSKAGGGDIGRSRRGRAPFSLRSLLARDAPLRAGANRCATA